MVDSAERERFDEAKKEIIQILESDDLKGVPLLVLGNKNDLEVCQLLAFCLSGFDGLFQGSQSRDSIVENFGLGKYIDGDADDDEERILEVRPTLTPASFRDF